MDNGTFVAFTPSAAVQKKILNTIDELVCALDPAGRFVYLNEAAYPILGYKPEELIGVSCFDLIIAEDRHGSQEATVANQHGANISEYKNRYRHKDGRIIHMFWKGGWDFGDKLLYATGKDITEQHKLEQLQLAQSTALKATQNELGQLLERLTDGFIGLDNSVRITYWNKAAETISGLPAQNMIGRILWDVLPEPTLSVARQHYEAIIAANTPVQMEYYSKRISRWIEVSTYTSESGLSVFFRDITDRKNLQEQLIREKEQQQKAIANAVVKAAEKERAEVSKELHDNVNQVLTTVKLYNELCLDDEGKREELLRKSIELIQVSINEIRGLSRRLSAPSIGRITLAESVQELADNIQATNRFQVDFTRNVTNLVVSEELHITVYRILQEHFTNIIKHAGASLVTIAMYVQDHVLTVTVTDNGVGMDPHKTHRGIGITNMKNRAEQAGGTITISATPGAGCTMLLQVPLPSKEN